MKKSTITILVLGGIILVGIAAFAIIQLVSSRHEVSKLKKDGETKEQYIELYQRDSAKCAGLQEENENLLAQLDTTVLKKVNDSLLVLVDSLDQKIVQINKELALEKKKVNQPTPTAGLPQKVGKVGSKGR